MPPDVAPPVLLAAAPVLEPPEEDAAAELLPPPVADAEVAEALPVEVPDEPAALDVAGNNAPVLVPEVPAVDCMQPAATTIAHAAPNNALPSLMMFRPSTASLPEPAQFHDHGKAGRLTAPELSVTDRCSSTSRSGPSDSFRSCCPSPFRTRGHSPR